MKDSPAIQLIAQLWNHRQESTSHSWLRMNQGLHEGLMLAVKLGLTFDENDIDVLFERFRASYWIGSDTEVFYVLSVYFGNRSAWKAYETHRKRIPFIWTPAQLEIAGNRTMLNPPRLTVGCRFTWKDEEVKVSSFNDEKGYLNALSFIRDDGLSCEKCGSFTTWPKSKTLHQYKITHDDLKAAKKALKGNLA